jgi:hypothetical protein
MAIEVLIILLSSIGVGAVSAIGFILVALFLVVGLNKIFKGDD